MRPLPDSPDAWGAHRASIFPHAGPASYVQLVETSPAAIPATGGDTVEAVEAGMKYIDIVLGGHSDTGLYFVRGIPKTASAGPQGQQATTYGLVWYVTATGAEVAAETDLRDEIVRLIAIGPK